MDVEGYFIPEHRIIRQASDAWRTNERQLRSKSSKKSMYFARKISISFFWIPKVRVAFEAG